jgi:hypothetical protein
MTKKISNTKVGYLECKICKNYSLAVMIPFNKKTMDKFDEHVVACSAEIAPKNVTLGYN